MFRKKQTSKTPKFSLEYARSLKSIFVLTEFRPISRNPDPLLAAGPSSLLPRTGISISWAEKKKVPPRTPGYPLINAWPLMSRSGRNRVKLFFWGGGPYPGAVKTFASTPPPWTLSAWRHPPSGPGHAHFVYRFSVSGQVQGGGDHPCHTHTRIRHCYPKQKSWAKQRPSARPIIIMRFWRQSPTIMCHNVFVTLCYRDSLLF